MSQNPFWKSTAVLLNYKRQLGIAFTGALLSAGCFGAGVGMVVPSAYLFLASKESLNNLILTHVAKPGRPELVNSVAHWLAARVPTDQFWSFVFVLTVLGILTVIGSVGRYVHELLTVTVVARTAMIWRGRMFRRLIHSPLGDVMRSGTADHISRMNADILTLSAGYMAILDKTVEAVLKGTMLLGVALYLNWRLSLIGLVVAPVIAVALRKFGKRIRKASKRALRERGRMIGVLKESFGGLAVVKVHNAEGYERRRFRKVNRAVFNEEMQMRQVKALADPSIDTLTIIGMIAAGTMAAWYVLRLNVAPEIFLTVLGCLAAGASSLKPLASLNNQLSESRSAAERIMEATELRVEPTGIDADHSLPLLPRHHTAVEFQTATFRYFGTDRAALDSVNLAVQHGQTIAIVGANGSGKTTMLNLLPRLFEPTEGRVLIDGVDIAGVDLRSLRSQIALVTQQTILFEGTIADNIAYGRRHVPIERVVAAAKAAYADEFIRALPLGYNTLLGEDGSGLSGGQKQRLSIARAILRDPAILILDEATSQIDADSEAKISRAVRELHHGRTIFIIAHRLSTVIDADLIVVMADGKIEDRGTHTELLTRCRTYQLLTQTQLLKPAQPA